MTRSLFDGFIYGGSAKFPREEMFGLTSHAEVAVSIAADIGEGWGKRGRGEFHHFLNLATGFATYHYHIPFSRTTLHFLEEDVLQNVGMEM